MDFGDIIDLLTEEWFWLAMPAAIWAAGAFCAVCRVLPFSATLVATGAAFVCGAWLTHSWRQGSQTARNVLLGGALFSLVFVVMFVWKRPPA